MPPFNPEGGSLGLPADFLIAQDGRIVASKSEYMPSISGPSMRCFILRRNIRLIESDRRDQRLLQAKREPTAGCASTTRHGGSD